MPNIEVTIISLGRKNGTQIRSEVEIGALVMLRDTGQYTFEELGAWMGLTRERVRQICEDGGSTVERAFQDWHFDPLTMLRYLRRDSTIHSWKDLQKKTGKETRNVQKFVDTCGLRNAVNRLFQLRKYVAKGPFRKLLLEDLRRVSSIMDRTATQVDINLHGKYSINSYYHHFGSLRRAQERADLTPNGIGGSGHTSRKK
jgi:hypothetical protein